MQRADFDPKDKNLSNTEPQKKNELRVELLSYLQDLVHTLSAILLVFLLLFRIVVVSGPSMNNTLMNGDYLLLINNIFYTRKQAGDIIVASKESFKNGEPIIKRIIATEGQTVDIDFQEGLVYVDGHLLDEPYISSPTILDEGVTFPQTVAPGCVFVMGDNRINSTDSRSNQIGQIDTRQILGKAVFLVFPGPNSINQKRQLDRIGALS